MKKEDFDNIDKKMKEILMFLDDLTETCKKYETTLKLEDINKIHSKVDVININITTNVLTILEILINEVTDAEEGSTGISIRSAIQARNPVGSIQLVSKKTLPEDNTGWLICDGKTYKSEEYPALHKLYMTNNLNKNNTFTVPDLGDLNEKYTYIIYAKE